jgi:hypothetical protein
MHSEALEDRDGRGILRQRAGLDYVDAKTVPNERDKRSDGLGHVTLAMEGFANPKADDPQTGIRRLLAGAGPAHQHTVAKTFDCSGETRSFSGAFVQIRYPL